LTKCIAFHSYKGGTGKTTLAANFAALLAKNGYRAFLLDLDVYAPSLHSYFETEPKKWINDFLYENAELDEVVIDFTSIIKGTGGTQSLGYQARPKGHKRSSTEHKEGGELGVAFCNPKKEEIYKLEGGSPSPSRPDTSKIHLLRRFILLRELLISEYHADYVIIDTSPGIRYWSINALAVADTLLLTLKMGDLDIAGTKKLAEEIYGSFTKFGTKSFLLWNRVAGYCVPHGAVDHIISGPNAAATSTDSQRHASKSVLVQQQQSTETDMKNVLSTETGMEVISAIPCYCDIQFSRKEFLTVLEHPDHPFTKQFEGLIRTVEPI
jgi:MinD-like ATPase involved in chromosome partitioning or flagellar assembly